MLNSSQWNSLPYKWKIMLFSLNFLLSFPFFISFGLFFHPLSWEGEKIHITSTWWKNYKIWKVFIFTFQIILNTCMRTVNSQKCKKREQNIFGKQLMFVDHHYSHVLLLFFLFWKTNNFPRHKVLGHDWHKWIFRQRWCTVARNI